MMKLEIEFDVRGSSPIKFAEGWKTGNMMQGGIEINTVWFNDKERYGGCIDRDEAMQLRDFLNECEKKWCEEATLISQGEE